MWQRIFEGTFSRVYRDEESGDAGGDGGAGGAGGTDRDTFIGSLPEGVREHPSLSTINNVGDLAKSFIHAQEMVGADKIKLVDPDKATPDEVAKFFNSLGRPEEANGYGFTKPEDLPEEVPYDEEFVGAFGEAAHQLGLSARQAKGLMKWYMGQQVSSFENIGKDADAAKAAAEQVLKTEFGDAYDERVGLCGRVISEYGGKELVDYLDETGLGDHPAIVKAFANIGMRLKEDNLLGGGSSEFGTTPAEAQREIAQLQGDSEFMRMYQDRTLPGHEAAQARMTALFKAAYPEPEDRMTPTAFGQ